MGSRGGNGVMVKQFHNYINVACSAAERYHRREMVKHEYKMYCRLYRTNEKLVPRADFAPYFRWSLAFLDHLFEIECAVKDEKEPHPLPMFAYFPKSQEYREHWIQTLSDYNLEREFKRIERDAGDFGITIERPEWL